MNLRDEILAAEKNIGRHPLGTFEGRIEEIKHVELQHGYEKWEITVATDHGRVRSDAFVPNFSQVQYAQDTAKARKGYIDGMARLSRTFVDLGLPPIDGADHVAMENSVRDRIGEWIGQPCRVTVVEDKRDARYIRAWIGASQKGQPVGASAAGNFGPGSLTDIPF
jgi:hypothetical protein